ncbi:unnamed protein product, partial [Meganyctiphanes norvegica]
YDQGDSSSAFGKLGNTLLTPFRGPQQDYVGECEMGGQVAPVKLRSRCTMQAIGTFKDRQETINKPIRYSFGQLILALRNGNLKDRLEVAVVQATELPPGIDKPQLEIK